MTARKAAADVAAMATPVLVSPLAELSTRVCWMVAGVEGAASLLGNTRSCDQCGLHCYLFLRRLYTNMQRDQVKSEINPEVANQLDALSFSAGMPSQM